MTDVFTKEKRSWVMSRIRGRDTGIEKATAVMLRRSGLHYRRFPRLSGSPDFVVEGRVLVFCDGDFWHGYNYARKKRLAKKFWRDKIETNMARDKRVGRKLRSDGWSVVRLWEHDIQKDPEKCLRRISRVLASRRW